VPAGSAAERAAQPGVFTGYGFDACTAPSTNALKAWSASPYRALGIYLGGVNRACADGNLSATWVTTTLGMGWSLLPLYVGLQAPCVSQSRLAKISTSTTTATSQGRAAADDAAALAVKFGLPTGSPVYLDLEGYSVNNAACTQSVQAFVAGWVDELHAQSLVAGVYGSAASTIRDVSKLATLPDAVWIANWNGVQSVFGDPYVSDTLWPSHQRVHQYKGGHNETWGGVTINIDSSVVDAPTVGGGAPAPPPPTTPPAGSVASGDGKATVTWPQGAFPSTAVVTLTPTSQPPSPNGYAVQLSVTDSITLAPVSGFGAPVSIHLAVPANGLAPSFSADGTTWKPLPSTQYTLLGDGTVEISTLVPGYFGLLSDTVPPSQPVVRGVFVKGALRLSWAAATDNAGPVARYEILLDGTPSARVDGKTRRVTVRAFHPTAQTVYRVRAVDAAGNAGKPSLPVVVLPTVKPKDTPRPVPRWAWSLFTWQHGGGGKRPAKAPRKPPGWYWHWAAWRAAPFHLRR
jgi:hypothetical protein